MKNSIVTLTVYIDKSDKIHFADIIKQETVLTHDDVRIMLDGYYASRSAEALDIFNFIISFTSGVGVSLAANWIYDKFKPKGKKIKIENQTTFFDQNEIIRIFKQNIEIE